jgi:hypothetical protein
MTQRDSQRGQTVGRRIPCTCFVLVLLVLVCAPPFIVGDENYGEVPIPGAGIVHLPVGQTDVALCSRRPDSGAGPIPLPSPSIRISSLDGGTDPEVVQLTREAFGSRATSLPSFRRSGSSTKATIKSRSTERYTVRINRDWCSATSSGTTEC